MQETPGILALDLASKTGYAHSGGPSGVWTFTGSRGEKLLSLRNVLIATLKANPTTALVVEAPHHRGGPATMLLVGMAVVAEMTACEAQIEFSMVHTSTLKKHATGSGRASKEDMIKAARKLGDIIDDNHADALLLLEYARCNSKNP